MMYKTMNPAIETLKTAKKFGRALGDYLTGQSTELTLPSFITGNGRKILVPALVNSGYQRYRYLFDHYMYNQPESYQPNAMFYYTSDMEFLAMIDLQDKVIYWEHPLSLDDNDMQAIRPKGFESKGYYSFRDAQLAKLKAQLHTKAQTIMAPLVTKYKKQMEALSLDELATSEYLIDEYSRVRDFVFKDFLPMLAVQYDPLTFPDDAGFDPLGDCFESYSKEVWQDQAMTDVVRLFSDTETFITEKADGILADHQSLLETTAQHQALVEVFLSHADDGRVLNLINFVIAMRYCNQNKISPLVKFDLYVAGTSYKAHIDHDVRTNSWYDGWSIDADSLLHLSLNSYSLSYQDKETRQLMGEVAQLPLSAIKTLSYRSKVLYAQK